MPCLYVVKLRKIARFRAEAYKIQILPALLGSTRTKAYTLKYLKHFVANISIKIMASTIDYD